MPLQTKVKAEKVGNFQPALLGRIHPALTIAYETFNAAYADVRIEGVSAHPMTAKGVLLNPLLIANEMINMFPKTETPEHTEGREGYWWFFGCKADPSSCQLQIGIRDHDLETFNSRKQRVIDAVEELKMLHPNTKITLDLSDTYANISNMVDKDHRGITQIYDAFTACNVEPKTIAMRGGTDGSALAPKGLVVPNYFTGGLDFHSRFEYLPLPSFVKSYEVTRKIVDLVAVRDA